MCSTISINLIRACRTENPFFKDSVFTFPSIIVKTNSKFILYPLIVTSCSSLIYSFICRSSSKHTSLVSFVQAIFIGRQYLGEDGHGFFHKISLVSVETSCNGTMDVQNKLLQKAADVEAFCLYTLAFVPSKPHFTINLSRFMPPSIFCKFRYNIRRLIV